MNQLLLKPKRRQWAMISNGAEAGKSTFLAANARPPLMLVDSDGRFDAVEPLSLGPVLYPTQILDTLELAEELILRVPKEGAKSLGWDSLTKLYSLPARLGFMRNLSGKQRRSSSKASEMIDKSNAMTIARDLAILGTDVYYCWHLTEGRDGLGQSEIRGMISDIETGRLMTSVNVTLEFAVENGRYGVTVTHARNFGARKANVGFTLYDRPDNYWRGAAELLEEMIYTPFDSKDGAIKWAAEMLGMTQEEAEAEYDHVKQVEGFKTSGQAFAVWYLHIRELKKDDTMRESFDRTGAPPVVDQSPDVPDMADISPDISDVSTDYPDIEEPVEPFVTGPPRPPTPDDSPAQAREALENMGEEVSVGNVVFAAATAWPAKFTADKALLKLDQWPGKPEGAEIRMDRVVKGATALKMFDWLGEVEVE